MPYLIDGHNLIGKTPGISLKDIDDEEQAARMLEKYFRRIRKKATVFFDQGTLTNQQVFKSAFLEVIFIRQPASADEAIIQRLKQAKGNAKNFSVVTSDSWVSTSASKAGAKVISSESFINSMKNYGSNLTEDTRTFDSEVEYWLRKFDGDS